MTGDLGRAARLLRRGKHAEVIRLLEPQIFRYRESFQFYHLLGNACLHTGDLAGAFSYLKRAAHLRPSDVDSLLSLAVIHLRRGELSEAIEQWLAVQDAEPNNRYARRGLNFLKQSSDPARVVDYLESGKMRRFLPGPSRFERIMPYVFLGILAATVLIFAGGYAITKLRAPAGPPRQGLAKATLAPGAALTQTTGQNRYILTKAQIRDTFDRLRSEFSHYDDNRAQRDVNRLLGSNASETVKAKARLLQSYLGTPNFATLKTSFSYEEVANDPFLYQNCFVDWKGMVTNLHVGSKQITFHFLVGYQSGRVLQGIVPVHLDFAADVRTSTPYEILGQVKLQGDKKFTLKGISIHELMPGGG